MADDDVLFGDIRAPRVRIRTPASATSFGNVAAGAALPPGSPMTVTADSLARGVKTNEIPAKEWCLVEDVLNVSDTFTFTVANVDGENADKFTVGQMLQVDISDPDVASGQFIRHFVGRVTAVDYGSDMLGGSVICVTAMDLGWHLTTCHAPPLKNIKGLKLPGLIDLILDPTWGFSRSAPLLGAPSFTTSAGFVVLTTNDINKRLRHGRQVIVINHRPQLGAVLPFIQIEPGQTPWDILKLYAARVGLLVNVSARGELVLFQPRYDQDPLYRVDYHAVRDAASNSNNLAGRPSRRETIDGLYSEVQCWSTVVIPPEVQNTENPNEMYRHDSYVPVNPLPFYRLFVHSDGEAISVTLRKNRAQWKQQIDAFNSWEYSCEFSRISQGGGFFIADTMISVNDTVNNVVGAHYVQRTQKSMSIREGLRTKLTVRKPGLLNPALDALPAGKTVRPKKPVP